MGEIPPPWFTSTHYKIGDTEIQHCIQYITNIPHSVLTGDVNAHSTLRQSYIDDHGGQLKADVISNSDHITLNTNTSTGVPKTTLQQTSLPESHCTTRYRGQGSNDSRMNVVEPPRGRSFIWQIGVNSSIQDRLQVDRGFYGVESLTTGPDYDTLILLLALAGDVHPHPRPSRYPCSVCTSQGTSYLCTTCWHWIHSRCSGLRNAADYRKANGWICTACMTPPQPRAHSPPPSPAHTPTRPPCQTRRWTYYSGTPMVSATNRRN